MGSRHYGRPIDIWSVGCIFAELLGRRILFQAQSPIQQVSQPALKKELRKCVVAEGVKEHFSLCFHKRSTTRHQRSNFPLSLLSLSLHFFFFSSSFDLRVAVGPDYRSPGDSSCCCPPFSLRGGPGPHPAWQSQAGEYHHGWEGKSHGNEGSFLTLGFFFFYPSHRCLSFTCSLEKPPTKLCICSAGCWSLIQ